MVDVEAHPIVDLMRSESKPVSGAPAATQAAVKGSTAKPAPDAESVRFREVLLGLVRKGLMSEDEARSAWYARRALARGTGIM